MYIVSALLHTARSFFMEQLPQSILNVNHQLLKNILHINSDFVILLSHSYFKFRLLHINIKCWKDPAKGIKWTAYVKMINSLQLLTNFSNHSILDVWERPCYANAYISETRNNFCYWFAMDFF